MEHVPDAPWIRDAEINGVGPEDDDDSPDYSEQINMLYNAYDELEEAAEWILDVEEDLIKTEFTDDFRELIHNIHAISAEINNEIKKIEKASAY